MFRKSSLNGLYTPFGSPVCGGTETFFSIKKGFISKTYPSFLTIKEVFSKIIPSFFTIKEGSTFLTKPLFPQGREDVTALRCSEPLRYKVGGPSKVSPCCAGWDRLIMDLYHKSMLLYHFSDKTILSQANSLI